MKVITIERGSERYGISFSFDPNQEQVEVFQKNITEGEQPGIRDRIQSAANKAFPGQWIWVDVEAVAIPPEKKYCLSLNLVRRRPEEGETWADIFYLELSKEEFDKVDEAQKQDSETCKNFMHDFILARLEKKLFTREGWEVISRDASCDYNWGDCVMYHLRSDLGMEDRSTFEGRTLFYTLEVNQDELIAPDKSAKWELFQNKEDTIPAIVDFHAEISLKDGYISPQDPRFLKSGDLYDLEHNMDFAKGIVTFPDGSTVECEKEEDFLRLKGAN